MSTEAGLRIYEFIAAMTAKHRLPDLPVPNARSCESVSYLATMRVVLNLLALRHRSASIAPSLMRVRRNAGSCRNV